METKKKVIVSRPVNGISIKGLEYLLGENGRVKEFAGKKEAVQFLKDNGIFDRDVGDYVYREIQTMKRKPVKPYESLKKPAPKRLRHDRDDDRGR
jgi:hypothetical protein